MNKKIFKRVLALSMSFFMAVSSFNVYAQDDIDTSVDTSEETTDNYDADASTDDIAYDDSMDSDYAVDDEEVDSQTTTELPINTSVDSDPTLDSLEDNLEYFLVENPVLNAPETQNFVASFIDASNYSDFSITVKDSSGNEEEIKSSTVSGNLVKFSKEYTKANSGEYSVTKISYVKNECVYYLDLSSMDIKFGVDQEYDGYDELVSLDSLSEDSSLEGVVQVTSLEDAESEVASGIAGESAMSISDFENEISAQSNENVTICLDPGHGGADGGASGNGVNEKNLTLKIANYCKEELEKYNCTVVMTRTTDIRLGETASSDLVNRVQVAKNAGAQYIISIHVNSSTTNTAAHGAVVYYPNTSSKPDLSTQGKALASSIISQLGNLGIKMNGIYVRGFDSGVDSTNPNSNEKDYYGIIRDAKSAGITGIIVEHCFISNSSDYQNFLSSDSKLKQLGVADAKGIVDALGLTNRRDSLNALAKANKSTIADGTYIISSAVNSNYVLDVYDGSTSSGANVQLYSSNGTKAQEFKVTHDSQGYITLTNIKSGKVLDVYDGKANNGQNVWQYVSNNTWAQKWIAIKSDNGYQIVSALNSNFVLDLSGGVAQNGKNIQVYKSNGTKAQKWNFTKFTTEEEKLNSLASQNKNVLSDGTYEICSSLNSNYVLDVDNGSTSSGANIQLYAHNGTYAQAFKVTHDSQGYVTFTNVKSGKVLDVYDGKANNGQNVWQYGSNNSKAQKWIVKKSGSAYEIISALNSNYVLDLSDGVVRNGKNIHIYSSNGTNAQKWNFVAFQFTSIAGSTKTNVAQMVRYFKANNGAYDKFSKYGTQYDGVLAKGGASTIEQFCQIIYEEAVAEGIRPEVVFSQMMLETGWLRFGGTQVTPNLYNFAGLGATDDGTRGASFTNVRMGIRAQVQHLKAYANKDSLKNNCVDPRFKLVTRGCAQYVEWLGQKENPNGKGWATAKNYGYTIVNIINTLLSK